MSRLFLRIFLWFWLVTAIIVLGMMVGSPFLTRTHPRLDRWQRRAEEAVGTVAREAAGRIEGGGPAACPRHHGPGRHGAFEVYVLDGSGRDIQGRPVPPEIRSLAAVVERSGEPRTERLASLYASARPAVMPDGRRVTVVAAVRRPPRVTDLLAPRWLLPRLAILLLVVGLLAFVLARRITSPLETLRAAARRLAAGELEARAGRPLTRRRDEIGELARDFDTMAERLQWLLESQRRLLRDVSHELRSPLARIGVALELARRGEPGEREDALQRIGLEAERLNEMIGRILTLARLEGAPGEIAREPVDLGALVGAVVEDARFEARHRGVSIELEVTGGIGPLEGEPGLLRSALENVVRNAVRYAREGGTVSVRVDPHDDGGSAITVADDGPGVPEDELGRLFDPFYRTATARERTSGGAGLGLAITAAAVGAHGGSITAANRPSGGLEVRIVLPPRAAPK